jgi:hypothetical protein
VKTKITKYTAVLINRKGVSFDNGTFNNKKKLKAWSRDRGGEYNLTISKYMDNKSHNKIFEESYVVKHNRLYHQASQILDNRMYIK